MWAETSNSTVHRTFDRSRRLTAIPIKGQKPTKAPTHTPIKEAPPFSSYDSGRRRYLPATSHIWSAKQSSLGQSAGFGKCFAWRHAPRMRSKWDVNRWHSSTNSIGIPRRLAHVDSMVPGSGPDVKIRSCGKIWKAPIVWSLCARVLLA